MTFSEWSTLSEEERKAVKWPRRPHTKTATLFTILLLLFAMIFIAGIGKRETRQSYKKPALNKPVSQVKVL